LVNQRLGVHIAQTAADSNVSYPIKEMVMNFLQNTISGNFYSAKLLRQACFGVCVLMILGACSSQAARDAELAAVESARVATEQAAAARVARDQARQSAAEQQRQRELRTLELAREQAQQQRQRELRTLELAREQAQQERELARERVRMEAAQRQQEEAELRERERLSAIAAAEAERLEKLDRITELERQIVAVQTNAGDDEAARLILLEAIVVAEELLDVLTAEQAKYENTDVSGNTVQPLAKELIAELQQRKDNLMRQASSR
jgi:hypothetical protein